jgi:hypothetical protein
VDDTTVAPANAADPQLAQIKTQLDSQFVNDLLAGYVTDRQTKVSVQINQSALASVLGINQTQ